MKDIFKSVLSSYENTDLTIQNDHLFSKMINQEVNYPLNIKQMTINQSKKNREVLYMEKECLEEITLKYLKKRLDTIFNVVYPDRKKIMRDCFSIFESINNMSDFTIFKFDFENFFDSVSSQEVFNKYIKSSNLFRYERDLLEQLVSSFNNCSPGLPTSNALIEIISKEFDLKLKSTLYDKGLIFYSRYVDDVLIIFNQFVDKDYLFKIVENIIKEIFFDSKVKINLDKTKYLCKSEKKSTSFTYLG
ncbi:reverse transcriptase domain-containing protein, partial [Bacillus wiedmannii]|uniref:reverse transcriptase domain-containing protein n=1 Tax=Bacillus wiedmannii TaxID=1890302 RepID=UPI0021CE41C3